MTTDPDDEPPTPPPTTPPAGATLSLEDAMGRVEWGATPVGAREEWPPLLGSYVQTLLASKFSMWMGWGDDLTFFYNDAYRRATLGVKHPWALGRPAREVWEEIWDVIGPRLASVQGGDATWDEALLLFLERSGFREETYHTFSYSPISDAGGTCAGVLCVVTEETERVIGERRLVTLRQLASELAGTRREDEVRTVVANELAKNPHDLPYALLYLFDDDGTARLAAAAGTSAGSAVAPPVLAPSRTASDQPEPAWPVGELRSTGTTVRVDGVAERFGDVPTGAWDVPSPSALLVPLSRQGQAAPAGFLVAGMSPYRPVDENTVAFVELLAGQIASGVASARAYDAERRRAEALAELDRAKTKFFSNVSHEFRTPLTLILGPAEDALHDESTPLTSAQATRMETIRRNARRLRRLVNDMLDFARIEGGRLRAETVPSDLSELTRDIASSFLPAIERAGLTLEIDCPALSRHVHVDQDMWEKILLNLLSNALKFTLAGEIRVAVREEGDTVELSVADTGVGIAAEHLPRLFERFYRAPSGDARSYEGTGIGLALVHELVGLHGGTIDARSVEGEGSTFTVKIPFGTRPTATSPVRRESSRSAYLDEALQWLAPDGDVGADEPATAARIGAGPKATVLVADDNADMRRYISRILSPLWRVVVARDGAEALRMVQDRRPDLVLTDVMMPGLDGFGLLEALRTDPRTRTVPVVFLSARAGEDAAVEGLDAGADDYLVKPFSALELVARVRSNLELSSARNQESLWRTALIDTLDEAVVVLDASGTVVEVNDAFERILGFSRSGVPYRPPFPWYPEDSTPAFDELFAEFVKTGRYTGTVVCRHRDGRPVHLAVVLDSVELRGQPRFVAALRDVTAELAKAEREAALASFGVQLAEAGDVDAVARAGLGELLRVFRASAGGISHEDDAADHGVSGLEVPAHDAPGREDPDLASSPVVERVVAAARLHGRVALAGTVDGDDRSSAIAAPLDPGAGAGVAWLAFDPPRQLTGDERSLFVVLCGYFGQALRRAQLFDDNRMVATAMQRSILGPTETPPGVAVRYLPAERPLEVGGDWYDVIELPGDRLVLVVGDCVGRGLPAATVMGQLRSACRALLLQAQSPSAVVAALDTFAERIPGAACTTVFCGIVELRTGALTYCSAGHIPGIVVRPDGGVETLHQQGSVPLAVLHEVARRETSCHLAPGSTLVMCTDGLVERRGESIVDGLRRLAETASEEAGRSVEELADALLRVLVPGGGHEDDVAMVVFRPGELGPRFDTTVPARAAELAELRRRFGPWLRAHGLDERSVAEVMVATGEALSNAMEHACGFRDGRTVRLHAQVLEKRLEIRVEDDGPWVDPAAITPISRGRGMDIMRGLMDRVEVRHGAGTVVVLEKEIADAS